MPSGNIFGAALHGSTVKEVQPLARVLEATLTEQSSGYIGQSQISALWHELSYYGSNDLAYLLRGMEGVEYPEIVRDVCEKLKVPSVRPEDSIEGVLANEAALLQKVFADAWDQMGTEERRAFLEEMQLDVSDAAYSGAAMSAALVAARMGGFGTYRLAVIVANWVARALLGRGLTFGANAALTRTVGAMLGPVGWIVSGAWLLSDITSPAFRKTLPAVIQVAALRQLNRNRMVIGVVGAGSSGKDSLLKYLFDIDTKGIDPIPGATSSVSTYELPASSRVRVMNFPGFQDRRAHVEREVYDQVRNCNLTLFLVNVTEIPKKPECKDHELIQAKVAEAGEEMITIFNKCDRTDPDEFDVVMKETRSRLQLQEEPVLLSLKPGRGDRWHQEGLQDLRRRINAWAVRHDRPPVFPERQLLKLA